MHVKELRENLCFYNQAGRPDSGPGVRQVISLVIALIGHKATSEPGLNDHG